jgi:hypothetical protein
LTVVDIILVKVGGMGHHVLDLAYPGLVVAQSTEFAGVVIYYVAVYFTKISIVFFLARLFSPMNTLKKWLIYGTFAFYTVLVVVSILIFVFACRPISAGWDLAVRVQHYQYLDLEAVVLSMGVTYAIGDVWLLVLPIHQVLQLKMSPRKKASVIIVFAFGAIACAGAVLKCAYIPPVFNSYDPTCKCFCCQSPSTFLLTYRYHRAWNQFLAGNSD